MKVIGLTGPTGSGKTTALNVLESLGFTVVDCDAVYHRLVRTDPELQSRLKETFGPVFLPDGTLDRRTLGKLVFEDPKAMDRLNGIVFPIMRRAVREIIRDCQERGVVIDAINLIESGLGTLCDITVAITAPQEIRMRRIMKRDGIDEAYAKGRIAAQKKDGFYQQNCTVVLENRSDTRKEFEREIRNFFIKYLESMEDQNMEIKEWKDKILYTQKNGYDSLSERDRQAMESYCDAYKAFLDRGKTERECVVEAICLARAKGFRPFQRGMDLHPGDKIYVNNRDKMLLLAVIGQESLDKGSRITASHIDSPRLDLKPSPLYEEAELSYLKTHYYGGIRKYQWVAIPLELRGIVALADGRVIPVVIGEGDEPKLVINDLLPHLGGEQSKKTLAEGIGGEQLNILIGSRPMAGEETERVKTETMRLLYEKYGFTEEDFISAELEAVPAVKTTDIGLDRSMIGAYGHDDRVCAFASLQALLDLENIPAKTAVCVLADKEEIGSDGVTGMQTAAFDTFMEDLCQAQGAALRVCLEHSFCLSADVTAAYDPNFSDVYEKRNSARLNYGIGLCKYTGSRGKGGASDASAEVVAFARRVFDAAGALWQMAELGKVDVGGGGTVAKYMANRNIDTLDAGVPVLSMHAPFETVSKLDCYMTYKAMKAIYQA